MASLAPGSSMSNKPLGRSSGPNSNLPDRYAALQKKLEDLERVHTDEKKAHKSEQDRLKREIAASQRTVSDQTDQLAKLKKHHDALDNRLRELNKTRNTSDSELKELRAKLRVSEHERQQLAMKQDGASQTAAKERDELKRQLDIVKDQAGSSMHELERLQSTESELLDQLQAFKDMLALAAEQYGRLASASVSKTVHHQLKLENAALKIREARLERKLANSEDQVQELAHLIRHAQDHSYLLSLQLQDAQAHAKGLSLTLNDIISSSSSDDDVLRIKSVLYSVGDSLAQDQCLQATVDSRWHQTVLEQSTNFARELLNAYSAVDEEASKFQELAVSRGIELEHTASLHTQLSAQITDMRNERDEQARIRTQADADAEQARKATAAALKEVEDIKDIHMRRIAAHEVAVQKEKEAARQAAVAVQRSKQAEQALQAEIEKLNEELMDAMRYQTAYEQLTEQVSEAIAHSALAEEEAQKLSKFNAEILGHQNSSQKIMYVDRIRRELAETKQQLLAATRDNDAAMTDNMELRNELDMYKSISDNHLRTGITRVTRALLTTQSMNGRHSTLGKSNVKTKMQNIPEVEVRPGDLSIADLG